MADDKKYVSDIPELLADWDYAKNNDLNPTDITVGSHKKIWWLCRKQNHSWEAEVKSRANGIGCPYCSGRYVSEETNDLATLYPELLEEWDYEKNVNLTPHSVTACCNKKVWWKCKAYGHSWQAMIQNRTKHHQGCPYCSGRRALLGFNALITTDPDIAEEWDYEKNENLKPSMVTRGSNKKVWWKCKAHNHSWQALINNRTKGVGCPYCSGKKAIQGFNDIATTNPELIAEWDYDKNKGIDINLVMHGSHQKVWWKCSECGYEWEASVSNRAKGKSCPLCSNHVVVSGVNDLATNNPELLEEWDFEKNTEISPYSTYSKSTKKAWWICKKCGRSWESIIRNRSEHGIGCAVCSGKACGTGINDLQTLYPWLIEEFDFEKNDMKPEEIAAHSGLKIWWKCSVCGKSWKTGVANRTGNNQTGCPHCNNERHTSFPEQAIIYYVSKYYPETINGYIIQGCKELDIYIPSLKKAIEYDGVVWHTNQEKDERKNQDCIDRGISLIRVRENGLPELKTPCSVYSLTPNDKDDLERVIRLLLAIELGIDNTHLDVNLSRDTKLIQSRYRTLKLDKSLSLLFPQIAKEWCYERNGELTPEKVTVGSGVKVWWQCSQCGYEWETAVYHRTHGSTGCPKCKRASAHNKYMAKMFEKAITLQFGYPDIAKEWHKTKNGELSTDSIAAKSGQKAWWKCSVCGNEWQATVSNRTKQGAGCPVCARLRSRYQKKCRKILCVETQKIYNSIAQIERELGISHSCIIACCKGKHQTAGGYHWEYLDDKTAHKFID
ncbi:zinc-ribbon domain-containing protein [uncultured Ruminococcus sp.]|uniref:zinc-ribbon domain-containing protein n=1 Tax=uncultured Ruminococcus sp. TaxID=165186 RepID=UPI0025FF86E2|nr:zinc-ribbon domain-containing protein [uncultured Ruminococcus sp.]